jgi:two-component system chemotaxis sensor kinase CheA
MFDSDSKLMLETLRQLVASVPGGSLDPEQIDRAFRAAHSIKSEAGFLDLTEIADAAHTLENSLETLRSAPSPDAMAHAKMTGELERLSAEIGRYAAAEQAKQPPASVTETNRPEDNVLGRPEIGMLREARGRNETLFRVTVQLTCDPAFYYPRAFLVVNNLEISCGVVQTTPSIETMGESADGRVSVLLTTGGDEDSIRKALTVDEVEVADINELSFDEVQDLAEPQISPAHASSGTMLQIDSRDQEEILLFADEVRHLATRIGKRLSETESSQEDIATARRLVAYSTILSTRVDHTSRLQLLDLVRDLRPWAVSHAAHSGKEIRFLVSGDGAVVYSAVAETIADALLHLVRNSIDHGIELPSTREERSKSPAGVVKVSVERMGERVRLRVTDDGAGVDESAVQSAGQSGRSLLDVLAAPGFTRKTAADRSSGRGVGLDSVVHAIRDLLGGEIDLKTQVGRGTMVSLSVPVNSRLVTVLVVESADGPAAIPVSFVVEQRVLNLRRFKRDSFGGRYYDYHGQSLPLLTVFGRTPAEDALVGDTTGIVIRCGSRNAVVVVTGIVSTEAVVRDDAGRRRVFSRAAGQEVPYIFPPAFSF